MTKDIKHIDDWLDLARKVDPCMSVTQLESLAEKSFSPQGVNPKAKSQILNYIAMISSIFLIGTLICASNVSSSNSRSEIVPQQSSIIILSEDHAKTERILNESMNLPIPHIKKDIEVIENTGVTEEDMNDFEDITLIDNETILVSNKSVEGVHHFETVKEVSGTPDFKKITPTPAPVEMDSVLYTITAQSTEEELRTIEQKIQSKGITFEITKVKRKAGAIKKIKLKMEIQKGDKSTTTSRNLMVYNNDTAIHDIQVGWREGVDGKINKLICRIAKPFKVKVTTNNMNVEGY